MKLPDNIITSTVLSRELLSKNEDDKNVYLIRLSLPQDTFFEPGDVVFVCPKNNPKLITRLLTIVQAQASDTVTNEEGESFSLQEALESQYELRIKTSLLETLPETIREDFWAGLAELRFKEGNHFCAQTLISWLKPMRPRAYSIASAQKMLPNALELVVGLVTYRDVKGGVCEGLSSGFLCKRLTLGDSVKIYLKPSRFRLPEDDTRPVIMVGPGTGIAPFKAFLEHRKKTGATGENWLFFGGRHRANDFLLQDFLETLQKEKVLTRLDVAFSRDQDYKIYVQDRMQEQAKLLWDWFRRGAYFYICGEAKHMAKDVEAALLAIIQAEEHLSFEEAQVYLKDLRLAGRYQKDVY